MGWQCTLMLPNALFGLQPGSYSRDSAKDRRILWPLFNPCLLSGPEPRLLYAAAQKHVKLRPELGTLELVTVLCHSVAHSIISCR